MGEVSEKGCVDDLNKMDKIAYSDITSLKILNYYGNADLFSLNAIIFDDSHKKSKQIYNNSSICKMKVGLLFRH